MKDSVVCKLQYNFARYVVLSIETFYMQLTTEAAHKGSLGKQTEFSRDSHWLQWALDQAWNEICFKLPVDKEPERWFYLEEAVKQRSKMGESKAMAK